MTTFYSTKRNTNVTIPNSKVCGYRMANNWMKSGYSNGVRAGRDNGVVAQKFSRFATDMERENAGSNCAGNTNWENHKTGDAFTKPESSTTQFEFKRPAFDAGSVFSGKEAQSIDNINQRRGMGNREIRRPAFNAPKIEARTVIPFEQLQAAAISDVFASREGKPDISTYIINIPDITDVTWLNERTRMIAQLVAQGLSPDEAAFEVTINKPLGREQRTVRRRENVVKSNLPLERKLNEIIQEVNDGRAESRVQQATIMGQMALVLNDTNAIEALTTAQLTNLGSAMARIGVPTSHKRLGIIPRFIDNKFYKDNAGIVNLLLFSKVREEPNTDQYNYDLMVKNFAAGPQFGLPALKLTSLVAALRKTGRDGRFLDLERGGTITKQQLRNFAQADPGGFAGNNFAIEVGRR